MARLEFYFDCSSPWTYLGFTRIQPVAEEFGIDIDWKPFLVGGVFNTVNGSVYEARANPVPVKMAYYKKDMADWARFCGIRIGNPPVFPVNSVKAMRGCFVAMEQGKLVPYATAVFDAYWGDLKDISQDEVMAAIVQKVGMDLDDFFGKIGSQPYKDRLRANTEELIARGGFGSPTVYVDGTDMYFGNDRIELIRAALQDRQAA
ncbi:2-hydroxychromene-2-carboxylate isomerase [Zavarzinia sp. CC-PAN008]|uniref:2-hydroxychromene-2-carboxylate isomerase n=1 Tax=Zavarzinia sp. CC-PAN008 TaxID=3243332 RepID=UPI003F74ACCE